MTQNDNYTMTADIRADHPPVLPCGDADIAYAIYVQYPSDSARGSDRLRASVHLRPELRDVRRPQPRASDGFAARLNDNNTTRRSDAYDEISRV